MNPARKRKPKVRNWLILHARGRHAGALEGNPKKKASKKACRGKVNTNDQ